MKFNIVKTLISIATSALLAYGQYVWNTSEHELLLTIGSFIVFAILLTGAIGIEISEVRSMVNSKIISWIFFIVAVIENIVLARCGFEVSTFIILNGLTILIYALINYSVINTSK